LQDKIESAQRVQIQNGGQANIFEQEFDKEALPIRPPKRSRRSNLEGQSLLGSSKYCAEQNHPIEEENQEDSAGKIEDTSD